MKKQVIEILNKTQNGFVPKKKAQNAIKSEKKEKNLCAKLASDANMDHTQSQEKLKKLNEAIAELKQKNVLL